MIVVLIIRLPRETRVCVATSLVVLPGAAVVKAPRVNPVNRTQQFVRFGGGESDEKASKFFASALDQPR